MLTFADRLKFNRQLKNAINRNEFLLNYFPCFDAHNGELLGAEALIRWNHPERGLLMPGKFISYVENSDFNTPIGEWVIHTASNQMNEWRNKHDVELYISINVTARQLIDPYFTVRIMESLQRTGLSPEALCIEFTENIRLTNIIDLERKIKDLKNLGVRFALDDFGKDLASLESLKKFPIDILKIDMIFVEDIEYNPKSYAICEAIINLSKKLGIKVVTEGVENLSQLEIIKDLGVDAVHGFYLAKPLIPEKFEQIFSNEFLSI